MGLSRKEDTKPIAEPPNVVGKSETKIDSFEKVTGRANYGSDLTRKNLLHAAVLRTNHTHADITSVDTSDAAAMDGVKCVLAREEFMGEFDGRVRHYGDAIAAVAAEDEKTAERALQKISYELDEREAIYDARDAVSEGAPIIHENNPDLKQHGRHFFTVDNDEYVNNIDDYRSLSVGDIDEGFKEADVIHKGEYASPRVNPCNLDTHCCLAEWNNGSLTLTETLASPGRFQEEMAHFLGVDKGDVRVEIPPTISSSFGGRSLKKLTLEPIAASLAKETGRPVKLWFDREEEFIGTATRHRTYYTIKTGVTDGGKITAMKLSAVADTGGYPNGVGHIVLTNSENRPLDLYKIPNYKYEGVSVFTNNIPGGEYRGIGSTQLTYALESHIDELVRQAGFDPIVFREQNFVEEDYKRPHTGIPIGSCGLQECIDKGLETFRSLQSSEPPEVGKVRGSGFAAGSHTTSGGSGKDSSEARVTLYTDGTILASTAALDHGQGSDTVMAQIVSEEVDIPVSMIDIKRFTPDDDLEDVLGSVASRSTYIIGKAVQSAAQELRAAIESRAADTLGYDPQKVSIADSTVYGPGNDSIAVVELIDEPISTVGRFESALTPPSYGVHFAEVEVDTGTGNVDLLNYVAAQDVGFAINPKMVEGQLEGAVQHGVEFAMFSEVRLEQGSPKNGNLSDYPVISPWEMPEQLECEIIESNEETGPYGAKGIGTPSMPPIAPAVLNAVRDATGYRVRKAPLQDEKIYDNIRDAEDK